MSEECLEVVQELELIMSSPRFARAENFTVLLRWLVEQALACRWHVLNEHDVARFVYGIQDHDPTTNSRIRRQMSRLRTGCGSTSATRDFGVTLVSNSATAISLHYGRWKIGSMHHCR